MATLMGRRVLRRSGGSNVKGTVVDIQEGTSPYSENYYKVRWDDGTEGWFFFSELTWG